jgi:hypothetical protein
VADPAGQGMGPTSPSQQAKRQASWRRRAPQRVRDLRAAAGQ